MYNFKQKCGRIILALVSILGGYPLSVHAQAEESAPRLSEATGELVLKTGDVIAQPGKKVSRSAMRGVPVKAAAASDFAGNYMSIDKSIYNPESDGNRRVSITVENGIVKVSNLYGLGSTVDATWNATSGTLEIAPQVVYNHDSYGPCTINSFDMVDGKPVMNETKPITMTLNENKTISMSPWGVFVASGASKGGVFDAFYKSTLAFPNGTLTYTPFDAEQEEQTYPVLLYQEADNTVTIGNLLGTGKSFAMLITGDNTGEITPQFVMNQGIFGDFYLYAATASGAMSKPTAITVSGTDTGFSISPWGVYCLRSTTIVAGSAKATRIVTDFKFSAPKAGDITLEGSGTKTSPYLVKTAADLKWIGLKTAEGEIFSSKYFRLENDIDMSGENIYIIGGVNNKPFQGKFDGNGKSIKNIKYDFAGFKYSGLFGYLGASGAVENLTVTINESVSCGAYHGGIVGYSEGTITNCHVTGTLNSKGYEIGGIVGYSKTAISGCSFDGTIYGGNDCGGIVGYCEGNITDCHANVFIYISTYIPQPSGTHSSGGIAGAVYTNGKNGKVLVSRCYASGLLADPQRIEQLGGIVGAIYNGDISLCFNIARIYCYAGEGVNGASPAAGGIVGYVSVGVVTNCYNAGMVSAANCNFTGGIVGYMGGMTGAIQQINNCYNSGMVISNSQFGNCALLGGYFAPSSTSLSGSCYDSQTTGVEYDSENPMLTSQLTSGEAIPGLSPSIWVFAKGMYPRLKVFENTPEAILSATPMMLDPSDTVRKVRKSFTVGTANDISWKVINDNETTSLSSPGLEISGDKVILKDVYDLVTIGAFNAEGLYKSYILRLVPNAYKGSGTENDPYIISTVADIETLAKAVDQYRQPHKGDYFKLANDLDFTGNTTFKGIGADGTGTRYFSGVFDGAGHSIKNLTLNTVGFDADGLVSSDKSTDYVGFFGILTASSTIKNLVIDPSCKFNFYRSSGAVAGYSLGTIENCVNLADVTGYGLYIGGLVGSTGATTVIKSSVNAGKVTSYYNFTGGITGINYGLVEDCFNLGPVNVSSLPEVTKLEKPLYTGGIAGQNLETVKGCVNSATIEGWASVGGIVGRNAMTGADYTGGHLINNVNYGVVTAISGQNAGAISGAMPSYGTLLGNAYDYKLCGLGGADYKDYAQIKGMPTGDLISGTKSDYFDGSTLVFAKNSYPVPASVASVATVALASKSILLMAEQDNISSLSTDAQVILPQGVTASLGASKEFKYSDNTITLDLGQAKSAEDILTFSGKDFIKTIPLKAIESLFAGAGTKQDPHVIATIEDMDKLASAVNNSGYTYLDHYFKLANSLDYTGRTYNIIGMTPNYCFRGKFDGNGKTLSNISCGKLNESSVHHVGMFGYLGVGSEVSNLTLTECEFNGDMYVGAVGGEVAGSIDNVSNTDCSITASSGYAGGYAGYLTAGSKANSCINKAVIELKSGKYVGGIAGLCYAELNSCSNEGDVIVAVTGYAGGLAGQYSGVATDCSNKGDITATSDAPYMGGFAGCLEANTIITGFENTGKIVNGKSQVGGIYGGAINTKGAYKVNGAIIKDCINRSDISGSSSEVGGISGSTAPGHQISGCVNYGNISGLNTYVGGIVGNVKTNIDCQNTIVNCENYGKVENKSGKNYTGGIAGYTTAGGTIGQCINYGDVTSTGEMVGGIAGNNGFQTYDVINFGNITGNTYAIGGICGYTGTTSVVTNALNYGNITASQSSTRTYGTVAGIVGYGYGPIVNCANFGTLTGYKYVGGIAGTTFTGNSQIFINNCYNVGKINVPSDVTTVGNIMALNLAQGNSNYYQNGINPSYDTDGTVGAMGLDKEDLFRATFEGNPMVASPASYPVPATLADVAQARFVTVNYQLSAADYEQDVKYDFKVGMAKDVEWSSDNTGAASVLYDGTVALVSGVENKDFVLTAKCGQLEKKYSFHIVKSLSAIDDIIIDGDAEILCIEYYDLNGRHLAAPAGEGVTVTVIKYTDGSSKVVKTVK